jgi:hypothetical protein
MKLRSNLHSIRQYSQGQEAFGGNPVENPTADEARLVMGLAR